MEMGLGKAITKVKWGFTGWGSEIAGLVSGGEEAPEGSLCLLPRAPRRHRLPARTLASASPPHRPPSRPGHASVYIACVYIYFLFHKNYNMYMLNPLIFKVKFLVFYIFDCRQLVCLSCEINPVGQWGV